MLEMMRGSVDEEERVGEASYLYVAGGFHRPV